MNQLERQAEIISGVSNILKKYDSVKAFALEGSHAKGTQTEYSDIDFVVVFQTDERKDIRAIFDEVAGMRPVLCTLYQLFDANSLILYENGVRLDLSMVKPSVIKTWSFSDIKVLFDADDTFTSIPHQYHEANKPTWNESEGSYVDWFFWMFRQAYCYACQSERVAEKSFDKVFLAQDSIQSIRNNLLQTIYYVHGSRDYLGNISKEYAQKLLATYSSSGVDDMLDAIVLLLSLYEDVFKVYCIKEDLAFPYEKINRMRDLFKEFDLARDKPAQA